MGQQTCCFYLNSVKTDEESEISVLVDKTDFGYKDQERLKLEAHTRDCIQ